MRLTKEDWLLRGMQTLAEKGEDSLRIDLLCKELNVSKGSFYHHFTNVDEFIVELMKYWEKINTQLIIEETEKQTDPDQKMLKLNEQVNKNKDHLTEVRIRAWAERNATVKKYLNKVDNLRLKYLCKLHQERGIGEENALILARMEMASLVGMQHLYRDLPMQERKKISDIFYTLLKQLKL